ncbi:hypothetical protein SAMN05444157_0457 [Frankineae bacterium MT45]|nr:hypothetical protein SAMN05444157_0457 [Frankineae bacterium MT45]
MSGESLRYRLTVGCESGGVRMPILQTAGVWVEAATALNLACAIIGKPLNLADETMQRSGVVAAPCIPFGWRYVKHLPVAGVSIDRVVLDAAGHETAVDTSFAGLHLDAKRAGELPSVAAIGRRPASRILWRAEKAA